MPLAAAALDRVVGRRDTSAAASASASMRRKVASNLGYSYRCGW